MARKAHKKMNKESFILLHERMTRLARVLIVGYAVLCVMVNLITFNLALASKYESSQCSISDTILILNAIPCFLIMFVFAVISVFIVTDVYSYVMYDAGAFYIMHEP